MRDIKVWLVALALVAPVAACGGGAAEGAEGTTPAAQYQGPVQSEDVATGEQLFTDVCGTCHIDGDAPDLMAESHQVAVIRQTVREGTDQMPPLDAAHVSDSDLEAVLAYMVSVQAAE